MDIQTIILAAGQGKRMHSHLPKILHTLAGQPLLQHVLNTSAQVSSLPPIVVYGHQGKDVLNAFADKKIVWVEQQEQLGTGHAVLQALSKIPDQSRVLILYGDVPLIAVATLQKLIESTSGNSLGMLTAHLDSPTGYGRIKRDAEHHIEKIIEEKDASKEERAIKEINPGIYLVSAQHLKKWLPLLKNNNAQHEFYLTDIIDLAVHEKIMIHAVQPERVEEIFGVNDRLQLATLERFYQRQQAEAWLKKGVAISDPARFDVRGELQIGKEVSIDVNVIFEGKVVIGDNCKIGPNVILRDVALDHDVEVKAFTLIEEATIGTNCVIGPFARIRPETVLKEKVHIGNFVEVKKSVIGNNSKVNHLTYVGDSEIGQRVNVGAGTITCNYDGAHKHKTTIGDDVFIGSNTELVAPLTVHDGATIGAGSTITRDAPAHKLTLARVPQVTIDSWQRPKK